MAYYDEDDAIVERLVKDEPDFLATLFATLADFHEDPDDLSAVIDRAKLCHQLREQERESQRATRYAEGEEMRRYYASLAVERAA